MIDVTIKSNAYAAYSYYLVVDVDLVRPRHHMFRIVKSHAHTTSALSYGRCEPG